VTLTVRVVRRAVDAPDTLWEAGFAPPLEGRWWYQALEEGGLADQFTFLYAVVERDGEAVGLAPMFVADVPVELVVPEGLMPLFRALGRVFPAVLAQRTLFVGCPISDEGTVAVVAGEDRAAVFAAIDRAMDGIARDHRALMLVWKDLPPAYAPDMAALEARHGVFHTESYPGAEVRFRSRDKADYFTGMKPSHRQQLRRKLRRSVEQADLEQTVVQSPTQDVLDEVFGLFMQTYRKATTQFERLDMRFFQRIAREPSAHFLLLRDRGDGRLVAFMLLLDLGEAVVNKFIGIDYDRPRDWMLYFRLTDGAIDWAMARGAERLQSGQTGYRVKIELGHTLVPLLNYGRHRVAPIHWVYALVARTITWKTLDADLAHHLESHPDNPRAEPGLW
jgi:hypothetical protein